MPQTIHYRLDGPVCPFLFELLNLLGNVKSFEPYLGLIHIEIDMLPGTGLGRTVEMSRRKIFLQWVFRRLFPQVISGMLPAARTREESSAILGIMDRSFTLPPLTGEIDLGYAGWSTFIWEARKSAGVVKGIMGENLEWIISCLERSFNLLREINDMPDEDYANFRSVEAILERRSKEDVSFQPYLFVRFIVDQANDPSVMSHKFVPF